MTFMGFYFGRGFDSRRLHHFKGNKIITEKLWIISRKRERDSTRQKEEKR